MWGYFAKFKTFIETPLILNHIKFSVSLYLSISITYNDMIYMLVKELDEFEKPYYFVSTIFKGAKLRHQKVHMLMLIRVMIVRNLRMYFQGNRVVVTTNYKILHILKKLSLEWWMMSLSVEIFNYDINFVPCGNIKSHVLSIFIMEFSIPLDG